MKKRSIRPLTLACYLFVASFALMGLTCPGSPLVHVTFTGGPQTGLAPLYAQFQGDVSVSPPLVLAKFRGEPGDDEEPPPVPDNEPEPVTVISWLWNFGDGTTGTGQNVTHTYTEEGCYDVKLTVVLSNGMTGSKTRKSYVCVEAGNRPPVADAGPDQMVYLTIPQKMEAKGVVQFGTEVQLDGSASSDPDNDPITYEWTFLEWPGMLQNGVKLAVLEPTLSDPTAEMPTFVAENVGDYVLQLIVDDGQPEEAKVASQPDTVTITVNINQNPVAEAGPAQNVCTYEEVRLDGTASFDPEGADLTFDWLIFSVPPGSNVDTTWLSNTAAQRPRFVPDTAGDYVIWLTVLDDANLGGFDTVTITATDPQTNMIAVSNDNFTLGPGQTEIDATIPGANELPPVPGFVGDYSIDTYEVTNCLYAFVLNYANGQGYLDPVPPKVFPGGNPEFNGELLIQIEDLPGEDEFCDIEYDAVHDIFFVARRNDQSMARHPVVEVSWYGALAFCSWLSEIEMLDPVYNLSIWDVDFMGADNGYRLGFEMEWEYAAAWDTSGMTDVHHIWGFVSSLLLTDINTNRVNYNNSNPLGLTNLPMTTPRGYFNGSNGTTNSQSPVGCYDMSGNVWEWIYEQPYPYVNPGKLRGGVLQRLVRSGSYADVANDVRSARRQGLVDNSTLPTVGFRVFQGNLPIGK